MFKRIESYDHPGVTQEYIVNMHYVIAMKKLENGHWELFMTNGVIFEIDSIADLSFAESYRWNE